jgi:uncharacterized membrane protein YdjX (TVP38/TMEM64 family)
MSPEALRRIILLLLILSGIGVAFVMRDRLSIEVLTGWVSSLGWIAPIVFIGCYVVATVFFMPGLLFTLAGGVLFGPVYGTLYNLTGATLGATCAFLVARYVAYDWVAQRSGKKLGQLVKGVESEGWRFVAFVRLVPLFPFNLLNYALGLTKIRLSHYIVTSLVFMAPGGAAYTYLGYAGREVAGGGENFIRKALLAIAVVATLAFVSSIFLRSRRNKVG